MISRRLKTKAAAEFVVLLLMTAMMGPVLVTCDKRDHRLEYDVDANGIPQLAGSDFIELNKIERISRFRSSAGHDYADDFESCRNMKHYFVPFSTSSEIIVYSPVDATVFKMFDSGSETGLEIQSREIPAFIFQLGHLHLSNPLHVGDTIAAGQQLGTVPYPTWPEIGVGVETPNGWKLISFFDVMTDSVFQKYQAAGVQARSDMIISREARDADPLTCSGQWQQFTSFGTIENFVYINGAGPL